MELGWLEFVVQGGALVLLAVVLWGVWRIVQRLMDTMQSQVDYIQASIQTQTQISLTLNQLCEKIDEHERKSEQRFDRVLEEKFTE